VILKFLVVNMLVVVVMDFRILGLVNLDNIQGKEFFGDIEDQ
jgi:hypothetical protein